VKFRHLVERARIIGADCLATGHNVRVERGDAEAGRPHRLLRAIDPRKDQSYVLYTLNQDQLGFLHFPLGGLHKTETRVLARAFDLPVAEKAESQEICFVGNRSYADFVAARRPDVRVAGEVIDSDGNVLGEHRGLAHHTVGQRRGLGIAAREPLFVIRLEPAHNRVVVGTRAEAAARELTAERVSLIRGDWPQDPLRVEAMVRYRGALAPATVTLGPAGSGMAHVIFTNEGPIASPGQALVLYRGDDVLGGGTIASVTSAA
jgi:tRNA-specific 2-thiouridylase